MRAIAQFVDGLPRWVVRAAGVCMVAAVGLADYFTGPQLSFTPFYLLAVATATWFVGRSEGVAAAVASTICWTLCYALNNPSARWDAPALYWNVVVQFGIFLVVGLTLSGLKQGLLQEKELARTDNVTGLANSRAMVEALEHEIERARRYGHPFSLAYMDADNFKGVNDRFGHTAGDRMLRAISRGICDNVRTVDLPARMGGDEFALLLPETGPAEAALVVSRIKRRLDKTMQENGWSVTFSIGAVTCLSPPVSIHELIKAADDLMYSVKRSGKDAVLYSTYGHPPEEEQMRTGA